MSILAFGGEMGFFLPSDNNSIESTSGYSSIFSRGSTSIVGTASYVETVHLSAQTDVWVHCALDHASTFNSSSTLEPVIVFYDSSDVAFIRLRTPAAATGGLDNAWTVEVWGGAAWASVGSFTAEIVHLQDIDFHIVSDTAAGSIDLYLSGTRRLKSGTIDLSAHSGVAYGRSYGRTYALGTQTYVSQWVFATEPTIGMRVGTIYMSGQGTTHTFDVGGYANIDELAYSDADFIQSGTAGQIELFTGTAVPSFTGYTIRALALTARGKTDGTITGFQFVLRSGGTNYTSTTQSLEFGYGNYCAVWETNPATSAAFQSSEIAALEYGVESVA